MHLARIRSQQSSARSCLFFFSLLFSFSPFSGLDGATTLDIVRALKGWCVSSHGSATVSLLQANPAVVAQFDQVILMREGCIVFSGSQEQLQQHLTDMRITPNPDVDLADWSVGGTEQNRNEQN
jgi:ABC-type multidrug transport system ATPase subunit